MKKASIIIVQLFCLVVFLSFTADAQSNCTYTVNPNSFVVPVSGGDYSLDITTQAGCPWTVTPFQSTRPPSISFTSPTSGTGSGKVDFTIAANTTPSIREGGIAVRSQDFSTRASVEIVQDVQCADPMFSPSVVNVPGEGSTQLSFGWSPSSVNCSYITVRSNDSWITLTGMSPEQRYTFSVAPNTGPARTGTISIIINTRVNTYQKIGTLTVNQAAGQSNCTYSYTRTPSETAFPGVPLTITVTATTQPGCVWSTTPNYESSNTNFSWVTFPEGNSRTGSGTITIAFSRNPGISRGVFFTFPGNYSFPITQAKDCSFPFSASQTFPASGGTGNIDIIFPHHDCGIYSFQSNNSWITPLTPSYTGPGNSSRQFQVAPNDGPARTGTVTVLTAQWATFAPNLATTITINQEAGQTNCTYSISGDTSTFYLEGGARTANVTTQPGCAWQAIPSNDWITITGGQSGSGSGTIAYTVSQNNGDARRGTINVSGAILEINQRSNCFANFNSGPFNFPASGGNFQYPGPFYQFCTYAFIYPSSAPWVTFVGGSVGYVIAPNTGPARTTTIDLYGPTGSVNGGTGFRTVTITQDSGESNCTYTLNPNSTLVTGGRGTASFNVATQPGCAWTANTFNSDWITITSGSSGVGNGTVNFSYTINTLNERRFGSIKVADQTFTLVQDRFCNLANMNSFAGASSNGGLVTVSHLINCTFTVTTDSPWITIPRPLDGPSFGVSFRVNPNPGPARTGTVTVKILNSTSPEETKTITVTQAGSCISSLSATSINIGGSGGDNFGVPVSAPVDCSWEATTESSWIQITRSAGSGNGAIAFTVAPNPGQARTGTIIINGQTFTVNQTTADCTYSLSPTSVQAGAAGGDTGFNIMTETGCNWTAASNANWITVSNPTGSGAGRINYSVQPNTSTTARTGTITVSGQVFTVNQDGVAVVQPTLINLRVKLVNANYRDIRNASVSFTNTATGETRMTQSNSFGWVLFSNVTKGQTYTVEIKHKRYTFTTFNKVFDNNWLSNIFVAEP